MFLSVALKKPNGTSCIWMDVMDTENTDCDCLDFNWKCLSFLRFKKKWQKSKDINDWIKRFTKFKYFICYNDDEPGESKETSKGHAKGVVMWNDKRIGWLIHSVPNYPHLKDDLSFEKIEDSQLIYGQSFVYIEQEYTEEIKENILRQIVAMEVHVYEDISLTYSSYVLRMSHKNVNPILLPFSDSIVHVSKSSMWKKDLYEDFMCEYIKAPVLCQTWAKPASVSTGNVKNVKTIKRISSDSERDERTYQTTQDHSKYAVSMDGNCPWVLFGDINHMDSQRNRGGGGLLIRDYGLWKAVNEIMVDYTDIIINPNL